MPKEQIENGRERFEGSSLLWCACMYVLCMEILWLPTTLVRMCG